MYGKIFSGRSRSRLSLSIQYHLPAALITSRTGSTMNGSGST